MYNASTGIFPDWSWCWEPCELAAVRTVCITARETTSFSRCRHARIERHESRQFSGIIRSFRKTAFPERLHSHYGGTGNDLSFSSLLILTV